MHRTGTANPLCWHAADALVHSLCGRQIEALEGFRDLRLLELGSNRIRELQGLEQLTLLQELWLGMNCITAISHLTRCHAVSVLRPSIARVGYQISHSLTSLAHIALPAE